MSTARTTRGHRVRSDLLDGGLDLFHSRGYHATGIQDIANAARVPKGSFYNHFSSKEELACEALQKYAEESPVDLLLNPDLSPPDRIEAHFRELERRFTQTDFHRGCMLGNFANEVVDGNDIVRTKVNDLFDAWVAVLAIAIQDGQADVSIASTTEPARLAGTIVSAWEGSLTRARAAHNAEPLELFFALLAQLLLHSPQGTPS